MTNKLYLISFLGALMWGCNKPSDLTSFLDESAFEIDHTEPDFNIRTEQSDSMLTFDDSTFTSSYFLGRCNDPYFGVSEANLNIQFGINQEPDFSGAKLDSLVLTIAYDTVNQQYGPLDAPLDLEIFEITQDLDRSENYFSSSDILVELAAASEITGLVPNYKDTVHVIEPVNNMPDSVAYLPHMRLPLSEALGEKLLSFDQTDFVSLEVFLQKFKGLSIRPKASCEGMTFLEVSTGLTRLNLYYTKGDSSLLMQFPLLNSNLAFNTYQHDFSGTVVQQALEDDQLSDSILYVQSMQGPNVGIEFTDLTALQDKVINYAELTLYLLVPDASDTVDYAPIPQMRLDEENLDGTLSPIAELIKYGGNMIETFFMGDFDYLDDDEQVKGYKFNITEQLQNIISGDATNKIVLSNFYKGTEPYRSILYGKSSGERSASIKVTFSATK